MILSRSADYALRAMIYLARQRGTRFVTLNEIATQMRTPPFLLGRLMQQLVRGGLLLSMKGHHGGFRLLKNASEITAAEIIRLIDGPFMMYDCSGHADCGLNDACSLTATFARAESAIQGVFNAVTLEALSHPGRERLSAANRVPVGVSRSEMGGGL